VPSGIDFRIAQCASMFVSTIADEGRRNSRSASPARRIAHGELSARRWSYVILLADRFF
jgi:hypothetical protein